MKIHHLPNGRIHEGDWLQAELAPGYSLAVVDGPYGMGKGGWDRVKVDDLAAWYTPHIERLSGLMAASATVYLWNTAEGWARLDPVMRAAGWTFETLITWDKVAPPLTLTSHWPNVIEVCAQYSRGVPVFAHPEHNPRRNPGAHVPAVTCVWRLAPGAYLAERLKDGSKTRVRDGSIVDGSLHPCQKPLAFAERMIRASSRPGERVLVPFGGTNREAVAIEWMTRRDPAEARQYDACELNQDPGRDYIAPVLAQIRGQDHRPGAHRQAPLFGGAA